jgi:flagellar basal body-associated protein FliL
MDNTVKVKAQVALEFVAAFICTILFLIGTVQLFVWFGNNIVQRQKAYENSRAMQRVPALSTVPEYTVIVPPEDFYTPTKLDIGFKKK